MIYAWVFYIRGPKVMVDTIPVSCCNCGADLSVNRDQEYVTCSYCESSLALKQDEGSYHTELKEQLDEVAGRVEEVEVRTRLNELKREWRDRKKKFPNLAEDPKQSIRRLKRLAYLFFGVGILCVAVGLVLPFPIVQGILIGAGIVISLPGVYLFLRTIPKVYEIQKQKESFLEERDELEERLEQASPGGDEGEESDDQPDEPAE